MQDRTRENAHRLAEVLERYMADPNTAKQIAALLNYHTPQLQEDAQSLLQYIKKMEAQD